MKKLAALFRRLLPGTRTLRGRVHKVSIIRGGEVSVVVRFGLEDRDLALVLAQGALLELVEIRDGEQKWNAQTTPPPAGPSTPDHGPKSSAEPPGPSGSSGS